ncbi:hypothetical protein [Pseudonocardia acaciae]|uniref:hypothetical protein n=1 Tax=Pseudonocardia acaciae TaxID=551276 RepID=UPI00048E3A55|nr:hypothetical protein [Pseudonocardia acaciae]
MTDVDGYTEWADDPTSNEQLATVIAGQGRLFAAALRDTHAQCPDGSCAYVRCHRPWPCPARRRALRALAILDELEERHARQRRASTGER